MKSNHKHESTIPQLISASQLAEMLSLSKRTVWRLVAAGKIIEPIRLGTNVRWKLADIEKWIESGCPANQHGDR